jgi:S-adenosylmethionine:tRNA-ribosyltransferase-isomerase (queuine synthetase)
VQGFLRGGCGFCTAEHAEHAEHASIAESSVLVSRKKAEGNRVLVVGFGVLILLVG